MSRRLMLAVIAAGLLTAGCGQAKGPRTALAQYIARVDGVELALRAPIKDVTLAGKQFANEQASGQGSPHSQARERSLLAAEKRIATLRAELAKITAPAEAARLRTLLLVLIDSQVSLTRETAKMVIFIPRYSKDLTPLIPAMRRLEPALAARTLRARGTALRRFASTLETILAQLRSLKPPAVSLSGYRSQVLAVRGMSGDARRLAGALESGQTAGVQAILQAFDSAAASNQSKAVQDAQIAAVHSYEAQVAHLTRLSQSITTERQRLADTVH
jgi:hypothetical protein